MTVLDESVASRAKKAIKDTPANVVDARSIRMRVGAATASLACRSANRCQLFESRAPVSRTQAKDLSVEKAVPKLAIALGPTVSPTIFSTPAATQHR